MARRHYAGLAGIVAFALLVRIVAANLTHFWFDEAFSWRVTEFDIGEAVRRVAQDNHSPFYFLLLKAVTGTFGSSLFTIRMVSVIIGAITVLATYAFVVENVDSPRKHDA